MPTTRTALGTAPLTLGQFKAHMKVENNHDDELIAVYVLAAYDYLEGMTNGHCIRPSTFQDNLSSWRDLCELGRFPLAEVVSIKYRDGDGVEQTIHEDNYVVEPAAGSIRFVNTFTAPSLSSDYKYPITVEYIAGYADDISVPHKAKVALLQLVAHDYQNREGVLVGLISKPIEHSLEAIIAQLSRPRGYIA